MLIYANFMRLNCLTGEIIQDYSKDKRFAAFGFGAKGFPDGNRVSHNFPINLKQTNPYCEGIDGVLTAYTRVLKRSE
jgi:hypothetical protein